MAVLSTCRGATWSSLVFGRLRWPGSFSGPAPSHSKAPCCCPKASKLPANEMGALAFPQCATVGQAHAESRWENLWTVVSDDGGD